MDDKPQAREAFYDCVLPRPELALVVAEQRKVIDIAQIGAATQLTFDELIEWVKIEN